jgi:hypothetical protein
MELVRNSDAYKAAKKIPRDEKKKRTDALLQKQGRLTDIQITTCRLMALW